MKGFGEHPTASRQAMGLAIVCEQRLQSLNVQRLLGDSLFWPAILVPELLQPLHLAELQAAELSPSSGNASAR
jgi:hypothetical protein